MDSSSTKPADEWSDDEGDLVNEGEGSPAQTPELASNHPEADQNADEENNLTKDENILDEEQDFSDEELYNPLEYVNQNLPPDVKDIFQFITKYRPPLLEIEPKLKPFLPDMIPAVGDIDAFLKVGRPDGQDEMLGLEMLDEPSLQQSDPSVLDLRLRSVFKQSSSKAIIAKTIDDVAKQGKAVEKWIKDIGDLHKSKPLPTVHYTRPMPDIDRLVQEWPPEVDESIRENGIPPSDLDCDLVQYVDIACGLMDVPVEPESRLQSLHLLFTLYAELGRMAKS